MRRAFRNRNGVERANMEDLIKDNTILFLNHLQSHSFYETLQMWKENRHISAHMKQFLRFGLFLIFLKNLCRHLGTQTYGIKFALDNICQRMLPKI